MDHQTFHNQIDDFLDGNLDRVEHDAFMAHCNECTTCSKALASRRIDRLEVGEEFYAMPPKECFSDETLRRDYNCDLSLEASHLVCEHLETCDTCQRRMIDVANCEEARAVLEDSAEVPGADSIIPREGGNQPIDYRIVRQLSPAKDRELSRKDVMTRRALVRSLAAASVGGVTLDWSYVKAFAADATREPLFRSVEDIRRLVEEVIGGRLDTDVQVLMGNEHKDLPYGQVHPDNRSTGFEFVRSVLGRSLEDAKAVRTITLKHGPTFGIGSPNSYKEFADFFTEDNPLGLKVQYCQSPDGKDIVSRYLEGEKIDRRRAGLIVNGEKRLVTDRNGWQVTDFGSITFLDNPNGEGPLTILGGSHGVGTRSFLDFFQTERQWFFETLDWARRRSSFFQIWWTVVDIRHTRGISNGRIDDRPESRGCFILDHDITMRLARQVVERRGELPPTVE